MSEERDRPDNTSLVPAGADRALAKRYVAMARRGLDLAQLLDAREKGRVEFLQGQLEVSLVGEPNPAELRALLNLLGKEGANPQKVYQAAVKRRAQAFPEWPEVPSYEQLYGLAPPSPMKLRYAPPAEYLARTLDVRDIAAPSRPRFLRFPEDHSIGTLYTRDRGDESGEWHKLCDARGDVTVQPGQNLQLILAGADVAPLGALAPDDLYSLEVSKLVTDAGLAHIKHLTGLQDLEVWGDQVTDAGLAHISGLTGIQWLSLGNTCVTDAGLVHLRRLTSLQMLWLDRTQITDAGLVHLRHLTGLRYLCLKNTKVTDAGLAHLKHLTSVQMLWLDRTQITDAGLVHLKHLASLEMLWLGRTLVTDAGRAWLQTALPGCDILQD